MDAPVPAPSVYKPEPNLYRVWLQARRLPGPKFNVRVTAAVLVVSTVHVIFAQPDPGQLLKVIRQHLEAVFTFAGGVLGFLLAGFTVFATIGNRRFFHALALVPFGATGLTYLQYCYSIFIEVMVTCMVLMGGALAFLYLGFPGGPVAALLRLLPNYADARRVVVYAALVTVLWASALLLLVLKSFVYNVYHLLLSALRFDAEQESLGQGDAGPGVTLGPALASRSSSCAVVSGLYNCGLGLLVAGRGKGL